MNYILRNSMVYKIIIYFIQIYNSSLTKRFFDVLDRWYKKSIVFKIWTKYIERDSYSETSYTYKILSKIGNMISKILDKIGYPLRRTLDNSSFITSYKNTIDNMKQGELNIVSISLVSFSLGYLITLLFRDKVVPYNVLIISVLLLLSLLIHFSNSKLKLWYKESLLNSVIEYMID